MQIAVIGASCFIGKHLVIEANKKGWEIIAVVRDIRKHRKYFSQFSKVTLLECNMPNYAKLADLMPRVDCAVYLTWNGTRGEARADYEKQKTNYKQSMIAIEAIVKSGCKKILTAGSQAEYGPWFFTKKCTEEDEEKPNTEYGKFKLKFYNDAKLYCNKHDVKLIEPRFFSLYGPDDFEGTMIISMLKKMIRNEHCDLTECKQKWDFLYIDDAVAALMKLIEDSNAVGVYNFGFGISRSLKGYVEDMYRITRSHSKLNYGAIPYPETGMVNVDPCVDKLKNLGWKPVVSFEEGIKNIKEYLVNKCSEE